jgi:neopullulanase
MELATASQSPPAWVADAVVYQIFPDRFRRSGRVADQAELGLRPWGCDPASQGFQGGDLYGVIEALDHLQALGITCLSLNPVFRSTANHRYHTDDYLQVDPLLGGNAALEALIAAVHRRGMRLLLDGVFNHCGRGFWAFQHLLENGEASPYRSWFHVQDWPLRPYPAAGERCNYHCWWNDPALPKFNHGDPALRRHLLAVARHWLEAGIDGWRLDVPDEVPIDFWQAFRRTVKQANPEAWIVGEIWGDAGPWLGREPVFDGVMHYPLAWPILGFFGAGSLRRDVRLPALAESPYQPLNQAGFVAQLTAVLGRHGPAVQQAMLNLLDGHDTARALHALGGDRAALRQALLFLFLLPGAPCVYYGTELAYAGGTEPACREAMDWAQTPGPLAAHLAALAALRHNWPALCSATLRFLPSPHDDLLLLERGDGGAVDASDNAGIRLWIALNRGTTPLQLPAPAQGRRLAGRSALLLPLTPGGRAIEIAC